MIRNDAIEKIRISWKEFYQSAERGEGRYSGIICPLCGHGSNGDGIIENVNASKKGSLKCFGCGFSGDILDLLVRDGKAADFKGAVEYAANYLDIDIDNSITADSFDDERATKETKIPAADYSAYYERCRNILKDDEKGAEGREYLKKRGILDAAIKHGIGFDPAADPAAAPGGCGEIKHPCPRIIIPTNNSHYVARSIDRNTSKGFEKMNPNTNKGAGHPSVFNMDAVYKYGVNTVFIVEGWADALSFSEIGYTAIALNSTSNGNILLSELKRRPAQKDVAFAIIKDNDPNPKTKENVDARAGELAEGLRALGYKVTVFFMSDYKDSNEFIVADMGRFKEKTENIVSELHKDALTAFFEKIQTESYRPYKTGMAWFDELLCGGRKYADAKEMRTECGIIQQSLLLLMAAPGTGKTTLCMQIAESMAERGKPIKYLNFEMSREQMLAKSFSYRLYRKDVKMTTTQVLQGYAWSEKEKTAIKSVMYDYRKKVAPFIEYQGAETVGTHIDGIKEYLTAIGERYKAEGKPAPAIIVDYLHLITAGDRKMDAQEIVKESVTFFKKDYAIKYNTFVIAIVATNRMSNKAGDIDESSGRDSSSIEYTADYQLGLNYYELEKDPYIKVGSSEHSALKGRQWRNMYLKVLKNRFDNPNAAAKLYFNAAYNYYAAAGKYGEITDVFVSVEDTDYKDFETIDFEIGQRIAAKKGGEKKAQRILEGKPSATL